MNELLRGSVVAIILWAVPVVSFAGDFLYQGRFNTEVKGIFLPVEIQGSTYLFLLDTGATYTTLDGSLRRLLGDPLSLEDIGMKLDRDLTEFRTQTIQGISDLSYFEPIPIKLGELDLADDSLYGIADLQSIWVVSGVQFHGIIGASFLRRFVWFVDFDKGVIEAYQPGTSPHGFQPSIEVPVLWSPRRDVPVVRAKLGDENAAFVIDSADGGSGRVTGPVFNALRDEGHVKSTFEAKAMSAGGEYTTTIFRNSRLGLADKQYPDLVFGVSNQNALGFGFLSRHNLVLDIPGGRLLLQHRKNWDQREEMDKSGLKIGAKSQTLFVYEIDEGSNSFRAGIRKGDKLIEINGNPVNAGKIYFARRILSQEPASEISMKIERDGTRMEKSFRLGADPLP